MSETVLPIPGAIFRSLARATLRIRGSTVTTGGWRLELDSPQGEGTIVLAESGTSRWHRGDGVCLGLTQEKMTALWTALQPESPREPDLPQLG
jgi:hypothetical protein